MKKKVWWLLAAVLVAGSGVHKVYALENEDFMAQVQEQESLTAAASTGWTDIDGMIYYIKEDGTKATGWTEINGKEYYFSEKKPIGRLVEKAVIDGYVTDRFHARITTPGWVEYQDQFGHKREAYIYENGKAALGIQTIDGTEYIFSTLEGHVYHDEWAMLDNGDHVYIDENYQRLHDRWFYDEYLEIYSYLDSDGTMVTDEWRYLGGEWYYFIDNGFMWSSAWFQIDGKWYYFMESGAMKTGWQNVDGRWYYLNGSGVMETGWQQIQGRWYYLNGSGAMETGWQCLGGVWYYFNESGAMETGWQYIGGEWYYFNGSGAMQTGWQYLGGEWYYLNRRGAMVDGWAFINDEWYYFNESGAMQTGRQHIGRKWYYFHKDGSLAD